MGQPRVLRHPKRRPSSLAAMPLRLGLGAAGFGLRGFAGRPAEEGGECGNTGLKLLDRVVGCLGILANSVHILSMDIDRGSAPRVWEPGAGVGGGAPDPEAWFDTAAPVWPASARSGDSSGGVGGDGTVWAGGLGLIGVAKEVGECKKGGGKRGEGRAGGLISSPTRVWGSSTPKKPEYPWYS